MRLCWANYLLIGVIVVLGMLSMGACGARGDLYLPDENGGNPAQLSELPATPLPTER